MKKHWLAFCLVMALLACICTGAGASSVVFAGKSAEFIRLPQDDLFTNFKNALPGDQLTQEIKVFNQSVRWVRLYLRAEPVDPADQALLEQMTLTVTTDVKDKTIYQAPPSETAQLTNNVPLGLFGMGKGINLTAKLNIPVEMGNEFMGALGRVRWTFTAEIVPNEEIPETGDWFQAGVWLAAFAAGLGMLVVLLVIWRKRRKEED